MTALAAALALVPLAVSQESGAIIASELAIVVIGGLIVSTALTLVVVPVVYSGFDQIGNWIRQRFDRSEASA
jgi:HAE1 family hydrophobic/amphiphilic exporter-1